MKNVDSLYDAFQNDSALIHHNISKLFTDIDFDCHAKQRKSMRDDQTVYWHF